MEYKKISRLNITLVLAIAGVFNSCSRDAAAPRNFHEWYFPHGICTYENTTPESAVYDVTGMSQEWIHVSNLGKRDALVKLTFYTESEPPRDTSYTVPADQNRGLFLRDGRLGNLVPINKLYGLKVTSEAEIMLQVTRVESDENSDCIVPGLHMESDLGYPGPLGQKEQIWMYVDCWSVTSDSTWLEKEWLNILNPSKEEARVTITFRNRFTSERTSYQKTIGPERMSTLDLVSLPPEIYREQTGYSVYIESSVPVVAMQLRKLFHKKKLVPLGMVSNIAYPVGDRNVMIK